MADELTVTLEVSCKFATESGRLYYQITLENETEQWATDIMIHDVLPEQFNDDAKYSIDGENWDDWKGFLEVESIEPGGVFVMFLSATVKQGAVGIIENRVAVDAKFCEIGNV